jgi:hypothetical protein
MQQGLKQSSQNKTFKQYTNVSGKGDRGWVRMGKDGTAASQGKYYFQQFISSSCRP